VLERQRSTERPVDGRPHLSLDLVGHASDLAAIYTVTAPQSPPLTVILPGSRLAHRKDGLPARAQRADPADRAVTSPGRACFLARDHHAAQRAVRTLEEKIVVKFSDRRDLELRPALKTTSEHAGQRISMRAGKALNRQNRMRRRGRWGWPAPAGDSGSTGGRWRVPPGYLTGRARS
jgi:hypothetical protein